MMNADGSLDKVKQEIFFTDVTVCFNMLKKAVSEMHVASAGELQMGQPSVRSVCVGM